MTTCAECNRRRAYMAADPELYRGDDTRCDAHRPRVSGEEGVTDLAPCPGCGLRFSIEDGIVSGEAHSAAVKCDCGWTGPWANSVAEAVAAWNRRAPTLRWRSDPPDAPGWWLAYGGGYVTTTFVSDPPRRHPDGLLWAGPIPEPEEGEE